MEAAGEFAIRGGIIDVYPYTEDCPYRIELWGDEIDSIRSFDAESQRSIEEIDSLIIDPATEIVLEEERIRFGLSRMEKDYKKLASQFHKEKEMEKEGRLRKEMKRITEELSELHMLIGAEGYLPYFYDELTSILNYFPEDSLVYLDEPKHISERAEGFYLEYTESMKGRLEGGYLLPKQADTVTSSVRCRNIKWYV